MFLTVSIVKLLDKCYLSLKYLLFYLINYAKLLLDLFYVYIYMMYFLHFNFF